MQIFHFPPFPLSLRPSPSLFPSSLLLDLHSATQISFSFKEKTKEGRKVSARIMDGGVPYNPRTVEEVFRDLKGRRAGMIKALTTGNTAIYFLLLDCYLLNHICFRLCFWSLFLFNYYSGVIVVADVEEFYQQCDPGTGFLFLEN